MLVQRQTNVGGGHYEWRTIDLADLTRCGRPVTLSDEQVQRLLAGERVNYSRDEYGREDWDCQIRLPRAPRPVPAPAVPAFTCPQCGGHRSTTVPGRCDDCDA